MDNSTIRSCTGVVRGRDGQYFAIPFRPQLKQQQRCQSAKPGGRGGGMRPTTEYSNNFTDRPVCYSSMDYKPLVRYDSAAQRSRNYQANCQMPYKNSSIIQFGSKVMDYNPRSQYKTVNKLSYEGFAVFQCGNSATFSRFAKYHGRKVLK